MTLRLQGASSESHGSIDEFAQAIVGNSAANILEGKAGADALTGGAGNDRFILSVAALAIPGHVDAITDYARGDIVVTASALSSDVELLGAQKANVHHDYWD